MVYFTDHAIKRCNSRGYALEEVKLACKELPNIRGETTWDTGKFKMKIKGDGEHIVIITVFKTDLRPRDRRKKKLY